MNKNCMFTSDMWKFPFSTKIHLFICEHKNNVAEFPVKCRPKGRAIWRIVPNKSRKPRDLRKMAFLVEWKRSKKTEKLCTGRRATSNGRPSHKATKFGVARHLEAHKN